MSSNSPPPVRQDNAGAAAVTDLADATDDRGEVGKSMLFMQAALEYGPFAIVAVLLILSTLANEIPRLQDLLPTSRVGLYVCVAFLALFAFVLRLMDRVGHLSQIVTRSIEMQERFIGAATQTTALMSLSQAFRMAEARGGTYDRIRIFAVTSRFVSEHMQLREFSTKELDLLVAGAGPSPDPHLESEVELSVLYTWAGRVRFGGIQRLVVRQYDFHPTEWFIVFDDSLMFMCHYVHEPHSIGQVRTIPSAFVVRADEEGSKLIAAKIEAFDALFKAAENEFGNGRCEGTYELVTGSVKRRQSADSADEDWEDLRPNGAPYSEESVEP